MTYIVKADLHTHGTDKSRVIDPNEIADIARGRLGENAIVGITNYADRRYEALANAAEKAVPSLTRLSNAIYFPDRGITIVRGDEIHTKEGDLLTLGRDEDKRIRHRFDLLSTLQENSDKGGINVITTPYFTSKVGKVLESRGAEVYLRPIDAIEVHDGEVPPILGMGANRKAWDLFKYIHQEWSQIGALSNSDGHSMREIGSSYTEFRLFDPFEFNFKDGKDFSEWLRRTVREEGRLLHKHFSAYGFARHFTVELSRIARDKLGIPCSKGDPEARYPEAA